MSAEQLEVLGACTALTKGLNRRGYELDKSFDVVVRALGWKYNTEVRVGPGRIAVSEKEAPIL
jgi:hypothetical protein